MATVSSLEAKAAFPPPYTHTHQVCVTDLDSDLSLHLTLHVIKLYCIKLNYLRFLNQRLPPDRPSLL